MRTRLADEQGFTLVELLVVILIIGVLAAIALPNFLGQRAKGQDASAKSDVRNLVSQVESCFATQQNYQNCDTAADLGNTGLNVLASAPAVGATGGGVYVNATAADTYTATALSESGNTFSITKSPTGSTRSCKTGSDSGGCKSSTDNTAGW